jgi:hypothetical protein
LMCAFGEHDWVPLSCRTREALPLFIR